MMQQHLGSKRTLCERLICEIPSKADNDDGDEIVCPVCKESLSV